MERIVGLFMVILIAMLLTTVVLLGRGKGWFKSYVPYYTVFKESYNLGANAVVKLYKADIGRVTGITVEEDRVKVELSILEEYSSRIRSDSIAVVESPTFIGSEYVSIKPGGATSEIIPVEGLIPSQEKKSINDIMSEFEVQKTAKKVIAAVQDVTEMVILLKDPKGPLFSSINNINKAIAHMETVARDFEDGHGSLGTIVRSQEPLEKIYAQLDRIGKILDNVENASGETVKVIKTIHGSVTGLQIALGKAETTKTGILTGAQEAIISVNTTLKNMEQGSVNIPDITLSTRQGVQEIREAVEKFDNVVTSLEKNFFIRSNVPDDRTEINIKDSNVDMGLRR
ncbi:MAG: MlaD family protein [Pseudomonadota bacterium]